MKQDRFLLGILAGIIVLAVISLALYFSRQQQASYGPEDTPQGVVSNYALALQKNDYERAYRYLAQGNNMPSYAAFRQALQNQGSNLSGSSLEVSDTEVTGSYATVLVNTIQSSSSLFSPLYRSSASAQLVQQSGNWKITSMPYPFWSYDWFQPGVKEPPAIVITPAPAPSVTP